MRTDAELGVRAAAGGSPPWLEDYETLRNAFGARRGRCSLIDACGGDAEAFLQGQLSQDVAALAVGESARTLLLHPDGKLHSVLGIHRVAEHRYWLDAEVSDGQRALERLERFKLRTDCEMRLGEVETLTVLGGQAPPPPSGSLGEEGGAPAAPGAVCAAFRWGSVPGWKLIGDLAEIDLGGMGAGGAAARECAEEAFEALRVEGGAPAGNEFQEEMIPAESGVVAEAVSFTKGCFVGQELTARIDSRGGNTPRHLRGVVIIAAADQPPPGAALVLPDGGEVGELTSVSYSPALGRNAALAYVKRKVAPPARVEVRFEGESLAAEVRALPLVP